jgi:hypothetical protein
VAAADIERFAGYDTGLIFALMHGVGIHDPRHDLGVGIDVGRRDIAIRADDVHDHRRVTAGQALELGFAQFAWVADDPAFGAAEGQVDDRAFPGHPSCERPDLVEVGVNLVSGGNSGVDRGVLRTS